MCWQLVHFVLVVGVFTLLRFGYSNVGYLKSSLLSVFCLLSLFSSFPSVFGLPGQQNKSCPCVLSYLPLLERGSATLSHKPFDPGPGQDVVRLPDGIGHEEG